MTEPYVGEIRMFAGGFAPRGWSTCQGQLLPISEYDLLFNLIGTTFGGDGQATFALPDLQGRVPVHLGVGRSGTGYQLGERGGTVEVTLTKDQIPAHNHGFAVTTAIGSQPNPGNNLLANSQGPQPYIQEPPDGTLNAQTISNTGGGQSHNNIQPSLCMGFIISLFGQFPTQGEEA